MPFDKKNIENEQRTSQVNEPQANYEKAELDLIRNALKRSHTDRFNTMMSLIKTSIMLKNAKVTHQPDIPTK